MSLLRDSFNKISSLITKKGQEKEQFKNDYLSGFKRQQRFFFCGF